MKKWLLKLSLVVMTLLLLPIQAVQACCGFIIGRQLTKDEMCIRDRDADGKVLLEKTGAFYRISLLSLKHLKSDRFAVSYTHLDVYKRQEKKL